MPPSVAEEGFNCLGTPYTSGIGVILKSWQKPIFGKLKNKKKHRKNNFKIEFFIVTINLKILQHQILINKNGLTTSHFSKVFDTIK